MMGVVVSQVIASFISVVTGPQYSAVQGVQLSAPGFGSVTVARVRTAYPGHKFDGWQCSAQTAPGTIPTRTETENYKDGTGKIILTVQGATDVAWAVYVNTSTGDNLIGSGTISNGQTYNWNVVSIYGENYPAGCEVRNTETRITALTTEFVYDWGKTHKPPKKPKKHGDPPGWDHSEQLDDWDPHYGTAVVKNGTLTGDQPGSPQWRIYQPF